MNTININTAGCPRPLLYQMVCFIFFLYFYVFVLILSCHKECSSNVWLLHNHLECNLELQVSVNLSHSIFGANFSWDDLLCCSCMCWQIMAVLDIIGIGNHSEQEPPPLVM